MIAFRAANLRDNADRAFIRSTWSRTFKYSEYSGLIFTDDWDQVMRPQFDRIIDRDGARALIAYEKSATGFFYGSIIGDTTDPKMPIVFFLYVKEPYRQQGIGRGMMDAFGIGVGVPFMYVCRTPMTAKLGRLGKMPALARFNPDEVKFSKARRSAHGQ